MNNIKEKIQLVGEAEIIDFKNNKLLVIFVEFSEYKIITLKNIPDWLTEKMGFVCNMYKEDFNEEEFGIMDIRPLREFNGEILRFD